MSVYVDEVRYHANVGNLKHNDWCHMIADDIEELHAMATKIGLRRSWFQCSNGGTPHYDLTPSKRKLAVKSGAIAIDWRTFAKKTQEMRAKRRSV